MAHAQFFKVQGEIVSIPVALFELRLMSAWKTSDSVKSISFNEFSGNMDSLKLNCWEWHLVNTEKSIGWITFHAGYFRVKV